MTRMKKAIVAAAAGMIVALTAVSLCQHETGWLFLFEYNRLEAKIWLVLYRNSQEVERIACTEHPAILR